MEIQGTAHDLRVGDRYRFNRIPHAAINEVVEITSNSHCEVVYVKAGYAFGRLPGFPAGTLTIWREV